MRRVLLGGLALAVLCALLIGVPALVGWAVQTDRVNTSLYTGDIGYMDEDGYFYIVDRKKDMIVVSGFNVFPKDIDECLMQHPAVADACTIGVPDAHSGNRPKSFVVLKNDCFATEDDLRAWCKQRLVAYKAPRYIEFIDAIPTTKNRKQDRNLLREREAKRTQSTACQAGGIAKNGSEKES